MPDTINILLVEDQTLMRQGLKTILDLEPGFHVVGEAGDGERGAQLALELHPDVTRMNRRGVAGVSLERQPRRDASGV